MFGKYALSSVPPAQAGLPKGHVPFHTKDEFVSDYKIIIGGKNFGCGSSREHAPIALDAAGIKASSPSSTPASSSATRSTAATSFRSSRNERLCDHDLHRRRAEDRRDGGHCCTT